MEYGKWEQVPAGEEYVRNNRIKCNRGGGGRFENFLCGRGEHESKLNARKL